LNQIFGSEILDPVADLVLCVGVLAFLLCTILLIHHLTTDRDRRSYEAKLRMASVMLVPHLVLAKDLAEKVEEVREQFGDRIVGDILRRSRCDLKGKSEKEITRVLTKMGVVGRLKKLAGSLRSSQRLVAVHRLGECGGKEAVEVLVKATRDSNPKVRHFARISLISIRGRVSIQAAVRSYLEDSLQLSGWRQTFFLHLASVAPSELRKLVNVLPPRQQKLVLETLGTVHDEESKAFVRRFVTSPNPELRAAAARVLGKLGAQSCEVILSELLEDDEWFVRAAAAKALGKILCKQRGLRALGEKLQDRVWWVRVNAAHSLALQGSSGFGFLMKAVSGTDHYAQDAALEALGFVQAHLPSGSPTSGMT
jgi:hypothetical protein